jgi:hypothetical protein
MLASRVGVIADPHALRLTFSATSLKSLARFSHSCLGLGQPLGELSQ